MDEPQDDPQSLKALSELGARVRRSKRGNVLWVDFQEAAKAIRDEDVRHLAGLPRVRDVFLAGTQITDAATDVLVSLERLATLDVQRTAISDTSLARLSGHKSLKMLHLTGSAVTKDGVAQARKKMIGTRIVFLD